MNSHRIKSRMTIFIGSAVQYTACLTAMLYGPAVFSAPNDRPDGVSKLIKLSCMECHDSEIRDGDFDIQKLTFNLDNKANFDQWVLIHDRVKNGEMPPADHDKLSTARKAKFTNALSASLIEAEGKRAASEGRSTLRRLNRMEYENTLQQVLESPWIGVKEMLPEDGTAHLFNKVGTRLDVSHVQISRYMAAAEKAVRSAIRAAAFKSDTKRYYAREDPMMTNYLRYRFGQRAATRAIIPLLGLKPQVDVIRGEAPVSVGASDPKIRELEAYGVVSGTFSATTKYDFTLADVPADGRYKVRLKTYTFMAGPNGRAGGGDNGLTGGDMAWWRPSRTEAFKGQRSEPVTIYALAESGDSRWLSTFDSYSEPSVVEREVLMRTGETIRPDATRLVRTRPGWRGNPNATRDGVPGLALNWLEVEGPLHDQWPPASYQAVFDDLPFQVTDSDLVKVTPSQPDKDASRLLLRFMRNVYRRPVKKHEVNPFVGIYHFARKSGQDFTDAMVSAFVGILCSPDFLYFEEPQGPIGEHALASRLAYFLWNGPADDTLRQLVNQGQLNKPKTLRQQATRMLNDKRSNQFINAFLDYWLDLRELNTNAPDAGLYPDYYLDDQLTEASLLETRLFFKTLVDEDLPARNLVDSDFVFVNERLAAHYDMAPFEGIGLRRVSVPEGSPRGGLITQASVLRVTANGTTTTPVVRGAWIMERIIGVDIPLPPSGIEAIDPDTRGATTIRQQLDLHRADDSCASCHIKFDPVGFALESFDVAGGWRDRYRAIGEVGEKAEGIGKNGHLFTFRYSQPVDSSGELMDGRSFENIQTLKAHLIKDERRLARNLLNRLVVYATGAPVRFSDRPAIESMLDGTAQKGYGVRSLIHALVESELFGNK
ncbi:MAG: hypothetical protein COA78_35510 [Blastopirellula sp.]|nr:MAG: hypothetical protein COA78_35510 [Blastopirellula sp.]